MFELSYGARATDSVTGQLREKKRDIIIATWPATACLLCEPRSHWQDEPENDETLGWQEEGKSVSQNII